MLRREIFRDALESKTLSKYALKKAGASELMCHDLICAEGVFTEYINVSVKRIFFSYPYFDDRLPLFLAQLTFIAMKFSDIKDYSRNKVVLKRFHI